MEKETDSLIKEDILALLLALPSGLPLVLLDRPPSVKDKLVMTSPINQMVALLKMLVLLDGMSVHPKRKLKLASDMMDLVLMLVLVSTPLKCLVLVVAVVLLLQEQTLNVMVPIADRIAVPIPSQETISLDVVLSQTPMEKSNKPILIL
jgi:hypothetical protein